MGKEIIQAKGNGFGECYLCKQKGKMGLNWMTFLYYIKADNYEHLYCSKCAKDIMKGEK